MDAFGGAFVDEQFGGAFVDEQTADMEQFKIAIIGETGAGKSSFFKRYVEDSFDSAKGAVQNTFGTKVVALNDKSVQLNIVRISIFIFISNRSNITIVRFKPR